MVPGIILLDELRMYLDQCKDHCEKANQHGFGEFYIFNDKF